MRQRTHRGMCVCVCARVYVCVYVGVWEGRRWTREAETDKRPHHFGRFVRPLLLYKREGDRRSAQVVGEELRRAMRACAGKRREDRGREDRRGRNGKREGAN